MSARLSWPPVPPRRIHPLATRGSERKILDRVLLKGEDAKRLSRIAAERGQLPGEVVAELIRNA
jgi:hypothetical protein